nr:MAG TPA: hypothetical protein [Caudoviricetes sp.]
MLNTYYPIGFYTLWDNLLFIFKFNSYCCHNL